MTVIEKKDYSETREFHEDISEQVQRFDKKNKNSNIKESWNYFKKTFDKLYNLSWKRYKNNKGEIIGFGVSRSNNNIINLIITKNDIATVLEYADWNPPAFFLCTYGTRKNLSWKREVDFSKLRRYNMVNAKEIKEICLEIQNSINEYQRMAYENLNQYNNYANNIKESDERDAAELLKQV